MKYLPMIWAALMRHRARTTMTLVSLVTGFMLFGILDSVRNTFLNFGKTEAGDKRLLVMPRMSGSTLPVGLQSRLLEIPGVHQLEHASAFLGSYQNPENNIIVEAHTPAFFPLYPELYVAPESFAAFKSTRTGALVGEALARQYGWKLGDKIPLTSPTLQSSGSNVWTFDVVGTFHFTDPNMKQWDSQIFVNWDYFDEARAVDRGTVSWFITAASSAAEVNRLARDIDAVSANSEHETKTETENLFMAAQLQQLGNVGAMVVSIVSAVFFTVMLIAGHTMMQAVRERLPEIAVLKVLGFTGRRVFALVLGETLVLLVASSVLGLTLALLAITTLQSLLSATLPLVIAPVGVPACVRGLGIAVAMAIVVGTIPALRGMRLRVVDALSAN